MDLPVVIYIVQHLGASGGSCDTGEANLPTSLSFHLMALELRVTSKSLNPAEPWLSHPKKGITLLFRLCVAVQIKSALTPPSCAADPHDVP